MIGCTPRGTVSYVSDCYGGSVSDRQIIEKSDSLTQDLQQFEKKDSIIADRGKIQDLLAVKYVHVKTPTMMKGKTRLDPKDVLKDRRVAHKCIHIVLAKRFKLLKDELPSSKLMPIVVKSKTS